MRTDFIERMHVSGDAVKNISPRITRILADPDLSVKQITKLFTAVDQEWSEVTRLTSEIKATALDELVHIEAENLKKQWGTVAQAVATKLRELRQ